MNPSHHGSDEQMFGAKQQVLHGGKGTKNVDLPMNGGSTRGNDGGALLLLPLKTSRLRTRTVPPSCSDLPIPGRPGMNPSHHGSDEQMFGAKQQVLRGGKGKTSICQ